MGSIMNVYLVDIATVEAAIGSKDDALFEAITKHWHDAGEEDDRECGCGGVKLDARSALRAVINGGPYDEDCGYAYLEACESICAHFGEDIDQEVFHHSFQRTLDEAFGELGMWDEGRIDLLYSFREHHGLPDPEWADGGSWSKEYCAEELEQWNNSDPAVRATLGEYVLRDVESRVNWMRASKAADKDIMVFWAG
ncbi:hypothetical protein ACIRRA_45145 [Nocardia sp. NPDC101769]|uniref:DUF7691 family protein n=1 Tax=Nocardia sp. NPDC101769 TaxID=3364333 RepID=UPI0038165D87